jgi:hypothetical protein
MQVIWAAVMGTAGNGGPLRLPAALFRFSCRLIARMADTTQKHDPSSVFAMRTRTGDLNGCAHRQRCVLLTNPLTDRHSGQQV